MAAYPIPGTFGIHHLFMAYTGYSVGSDGIQHYQYWETADLKPIITHINRNTGLADNEMFTDYLFLAIAVKNASGAVKYIVRNEQSPGNTNDWHRYKNELFAADKNINALYTISRCNDLDMQINTDVWIALPYPHPKVFPSDSRRISAVKGWLDSFLVTWKSGGYSTRLNLKGFYWIQESEYFNGTMFDDGYVMAQVNNYVHRKSVNGQPLKTLWIPYQKAARWHQWKSFGFDASLLQPSYYFDASKSLAAGAVDAYANNQGVHMEMDLGVTWDSAKRSRFIEYLNKGATGGYDEVGRYFGPYMTESALGWYTGGWYWSNRVRNHSMINLYTSGDPLYDRIYEFLKGTYNTGKAF